MIRAFATLGGGGERGLVARHKWCKCCSKDSKPTACDRKTPGHFNLDALNHSPNQSPKRPVSSSAERVQGLLGGPLRDGALCTHELTDHLSALPLSRASAAWFNARSAARFGFVASRSQ